MIRLRNIRCGQCSPALGLSRWSDEFFNGMIPIVDRMLLFGQLMSSPCPRGIVNPAFCAGFNVALRWQTVEVIACKAANSPLIQLLFYC